MIFYNEKVNENEIEKIKELIEFTNLEDETALVIGDTAYIITREKENFLVEKVSKVI